MRFLIVVLVFLMCACSSEPPVSVEEFNYPAWQQDKRACSQTREALWQDLRKVKSKLIGLNEMEVVAVLGKPDKRSLFSRNQKAALYYLDPAPDCKTAHTGERRIVRVLFNALNQAKEITIVVDEGK